MKITLTCVTCRIEQIFRSKKAAIETGWRLMEDDRVFCPRHNPFKSFVEKID